MTQQITLVEVGPRDGLQNECKNIPTELKIKFINALSQTGLKRIEITSFVSPKWVPQMADHTAVVNGITKNPSVRYSALVPNEQGLQEALTTDLKEICVFTAASETFSQKNTNCSIDESLQRIRRVTQLAKQNQLRIRGYISCALGCPYEGSVADKKVVAVAEQLLELGCEEISLGDTIGIGTPNQATHLIQTLKKSIDVKKLAMHFHDTYAQAIANIYASLAEGITIFDSSVAGLGGCPYAPGAGGNVATEDVVYLLHGLGLETGINLEALTQAGRLITNFLEATPHSKVAQALASKKH